MRTSRRIALAGAWIAALALPASLADAAAARQSYTWMVEHPKYGRIGTYTDTVEQSGEDRRIETRLRIAVTVLGIVMHREEADRSELWRGNRLISFHSVTTTNGETITVEGAARGSDFVVTTPDGTTVGPAGVYPSEPWSAALPNPTVEMSTKSGRLSPVRSAKNEPAVITLDGADLAVHHYQIVAATTQDVWTDRHGVPVRFQTVQGGTPIDFILAPEALAALRNR